MISSINSQNFSLINKFFFKISNIKIFSTLKMCIRDRIEVHDHLYDDVETETERWYTRLTFYGNDRAYKYNGDLCNMIKKISNDFKELDSYAISKEMYDLAKEKTRDYYVSPITKKEFPDMDYEELVRKRFDYLQRIIEESKSK